MGVAAVRGYEGTGSFSSPAAFPFAETLCGYSYPTTAVTAAPRYPGKYFARILLPRLPLL